ncbi:PAS domain-containing protein [Patescibacteria group bacterium]|nr:PAS domain-containing protein [Patescibacteria group bacterium]
MAEETEIVHQQVPEGPEESCDMLVGIDPLGKITFLRYINPAAQELSGYTEAELVGRDVTDFIVGADSISVAEHFRRLYASEAAFRAPNRSLRAKNKASFGAETYVVPSYDTVGKFVGHYAMVFIKELQKATEKKITPGA